MRINLHRIVICWVLFTLILSPLNFSLQAKKTLKVLAIGNSFSVDATEAYLDDLALAAGVKLVIGNCQTGGCTLEKHWKLAQSDTTAYDYIKIINGDSVTTSKASMIHCILDEDWDYITFQQASPNSGMIDTFFPYLTNLIAFTKNNARNRNVKFALHQTWAYASTSTHPEFVNYKNNQDSMYNAIVHTINEASTKSGIKIIIPSGTAIQNGRTSFIGDHFCRDGYHLSYDLGRYTAACTWFETLFKKSVVGNSYIPAKVSKDEANVAQKAAHFAVKKPDAVTFMSEIIKQ